MSVASSDGEDGGGGGSGGGGGGWREVRGGRARSPPARALGGEMGGWVLRDPLDRFTRYHGDDLFALRECIAAFNAARRTAYMDRVLHPDAFDEFAAAVFAMTRPIPPRPRAPPPPDLPCRPHLPVAPSRGGGGGGRG